MKFILAIATALTFFLAFNTPASASKDDLVGVMFFADWCGSCKVLEPRVEKAREDEVLKDVEFVVFDMTDRNSIDNTRKLAKDEGLNDVLMTYGSATGFLVIYDRKEQKVVQLLTAGNSDKEIVKAFDTAIKNSNKAKNTETQG